MRHTQAHPAQGAWIFEISKCATPRFRSRPNFVRDYKTLGGTLAVAVGIYRRQNMELVVEGTEMP
ncbi:MAG: hypothetical protein WCE51_03765 [Chthoniobacterales bacterium]